jgi:hypothetical protein
LLEKELGIETTSPKEKAKDKDEINAKNRN